MRLLTAFTVLLGLASAAPAENRPQEDHPAVASLNLASTQLAVFVTELNNFTGDPLVGDTLIRHARETLGSVARCVVDVKNGPTFDLWNTLTVASPLTSLDYQVHNLATALKAKKDLIDRNRMGPVVYNLLRQTHADTTELTKAIVEKLPIGVSALVRILSEEIMSTIGAIRDVYRPETDVTIVFADPNRPVSGGYTTTAQVGPQGPAGPRGQPPYQQPYQQNEFPKGPGGPGGPGNPPQQGQYNGWNGPNIPKGPPGPPGPIGPNPYPRNPPQQQQQQPGPPRPVNGFTWKRS